MEREGGGDGWRRRVESEAGEGGVRGWVEREGGVCVGLGLGRGK